MRCLGKREGVASGELADAAGKVSAVPDCRGSPNKPLLPTPLRGAAERPSVGPEPRSPTTCPEVATAHALNYGAAMVVNLLEDDVLLDSKAIR
jgi:hypothetical protein